jgi:hypothetical protein
MGFKLDIFQVLHQRAPLLFQISHLVSGFVNLLFEQVPAALKSRSFRFSCGDLFLPIP